jgi:hypothetical protein
MIGKPPATVATMIGPISSTQCEVIYVRAIKGFQIGPSAIQRDEQISGESFLAGSRDDLLWLIAPDGC